MSPDKERWVGFRATPPAEASPEACHALVFEDLVENTPSRRGRDRFLQLDSVARTVPALAHEIKNPLASIYSVVEVLLEDPSGSRHEAEYRLILGEIQRLRRVIDRYGELEESWLESTPSELSETLRGFESLLEARARHRGIRLRYVGESPLLAPLREGLLSTVVKNLLDNAIDAGRRGGLIEYGGWLRSSCFELRVTDDGEGMSQGVLARATEPFFTTKATGTGLGLALVQRIVERSGGSVSLWSQPGHGTEVLIRQPLPESGC